MGVRILLLFFAWFCSFLLMTPHSRATELGEKDLTSVLHYYENLKSLQVPFTQVKTMRSLDMTLTSSGILKLQKNPQKIVWDILKPAPVRVILTNAQIEIINNPGLKTEQVQILKMDSIPTAGANADSKNFASLAAWLDLDAKTLARDYYVEKKSNSLYEFTPKEKGKTPFEKLDMTLHPPGPLEKLVIHELSQDEVEIRFGKP
jgi:outer membrane lipoprotein-sorting protein